MVYPPVDTVFYTPGGTRTRALRCSWSRPSSPTSASTSRSTPAARAGVPLKIVGDGPERDAPRSGSAGPTASSSSGRLTDERVRDAVPAGAGGAAAGRGRLRHRAGRGAGLRPPGRRARPRRRARDGRSTARPAAGRRADASTSLGRRAATGCRALTLRPRRDSRRHAERFSRDRDSCSVPRRRSRPLRRRPAGDGRW